MHGGTGAGLGEGGSGALPCTRLGADSKPGMATLYILGRSGISSLPLHAETPLVIGRLEQPNVFGDDVYVSRTQFEVLLRGVHSGAPESSPQHQVQVSKEEEPRLEVQIVVRGSRQVVHHATISDYLHRVFNLRNPSLLLDPKRLSAAVQRVMGWMRTAGEIPPGNIVKEKGSHSEGGASSKGVPEAFLPSSIHDRATWTLLASPGAQQQTPRVGSRPLTTHQELTKPVPKEGLTLAMFASIHNERLRYPVLIVVPPTNAVISHSPSDRSEISGHLQSTPTTARGTENELKSDTALIRCHLPSPPTASQCNEQTLCNMPQASKNAEGEIEIKATDRPSRSDEGYGLDLLADVDLRLLDLLLPNSDKDAKDAETNGTHREEVIPQASAPPADISHAEKAIAIQHSSSALHEDVRTTSSDHQQNRTATPEPRTQTPSPPASPSRVVVVEPRTPTRNRVIPTSLYKPVGSPSRSKLSSPTRGPALDSGQAFHSSTMANSGAASTPTTNIGITRPPVKTEPVRLAPLDDGKAPGCILGSPNTNMKEKQTPNPSSVVNGIFHGYSFICLPGIPSIQRNVLASAVAERGGTFTVAQDSLTVEDMLRIYTTPIPSKEPAGGLTLPTVIIVGNSARYPSASAVLEVLKVGSLPPTTKYHSWEWISESIISGKPLPHITHPLFPPSVLSDETSEPPASGLPSALTGLWFSGEQKLKDGVDMERGVLGTKRMREGAGIKDHLPPTARVQPSAAAAQTPPASEAHVEAKLEKGSVGVEFVGPQSKVAIQENESNMTRAEIMEANKDVWSQLQGLSGIYKALGDTWRALAYSKATLAVQNHPRILRSPNDADSIEGLGEKAREKVREILTKNGGKLRKLETLESKDDVMVRKLLESVHGIGPKTAETLFNEGYRTLEDLRKWPKLTPAQAKFLDHYEDLTSRIPREEAAAFEAEVKKTLAAICDAEPALAALHPTARALGSYRRGKPTLGDIDILITIDDIVTERDTAGSEVLVPEVAFLEDALAAVLLARLLAELSRKGILTDSLGGSLGDLDQLSKSISSIGSMNPHVRPQRPQSLRECSVDILKDLRALRQMGWAPQESFVAARDGGVDLQKGRGYIADGRATGGKLAESFTGIGKLTPSQVTNLSSTPMTPRFRRIDIRVYCRSESAFAMLYFTGSGEFNRALRLYAIDRGYQLSDHGLVYKGGGIITPPAAHGLSPGTRLHCSTEAEVFEALGLRYYPPEERDHVPQAIATRAKRPNAPTI